MGFIAPIIQALVVLYNTSAVFAFAVKLVAVVALNALTSKLFGPDLPKAGFTGPQIMVRSAVEYRKLVYGQALVSGPVAYNNLSGTDGKYLWYWVALCEGEVDSFVAVHFGADVIPVADIAWTPGVAGADGSGTGAVSTAAYVGEAAATAANVAFALGHPDQVNSAFFSVSFTDIAINHRMRGVAWVACRLLYDKDTENVWSAGAPNDIRALVKGRKLYDPRLDSTQVILTTYSAPTLALWRGAVEPAETGAAGNEYQAYRGAGEPSANAGFDSPTQTLGSGSHRTTDSTTWAWSDNPALAIADYLLTIMGVAATEVDWQSIATSADFNEEQVAIPPDASPQAAFETRFTTNGVISLGDSHKDNLDKILSSMDGTLTRAQGKWKLRPSKWEAPTIVITADDLAGSIDLRGSAPTNERFNKIIGVFIDPARNYEVTEFQPVESSGYLARDNGVLRKRELGLPMTNSGTMAQRIAYRMLERGNNQQVVKLPLNTRGAKIAVGEIITADLPSLGWIDAENLALQSETIGAAGWGVTRLTVGTNAYENADGFLLADALSEDNSVGNTKRLQQTVVTDEDTIYTLDCEVKKLNRTWVGLGLTSKDDGTAFASFNLETGEIGTVQAGIVTTRMINLGDDWYRITASRNMGSASPTLSTVFRIALQDADDSRNYNGLTQESIILTKVAYYAGDEIKPYVKTIAAAVTSTRKNLRCIEWMRAESGIYEVTCREEDSTDFTDPLVSQYTTKTAAGATIDPPGVIAPANLTATAVANGIQLSWTLPPAQGYDYIEVYESLLPNRLDSPGATLIAQTRGDKYFIARDPGFAAYYWIRGVRAPSVFSTYEPATNISTVTATSATSATVAFVGGSFVYVSTAPTNAKVGYRINSGNGLEEYFEGETASPAPWTSLGMFLQSGSAADVEVYMEDLGTGSVSPTGSALDTWISAANNPAWFVEQGTVASPNGYDTFNGRIKARAASTQVEFASVKTVTLRAQQSDGGLAVDASTLPVNQSRAEGTCYAGVEFNTSGIEYRNASGDSQSFTSSRGTWLTAGASSGVWIERTVVGSDGTGLDWTDAGTGRLNLGTSRSFGCQTNAGPPYSTDIDYVDITFDFYDAASGGNLLDSVSIRLNAQRGSEF